MADFEKRTYALAALFTASAIIQDLAERDEMEGEHDTPYSTVINAVFNRFPENQILLRPPESTITSISENVPSLTDHGTLPLRNSVPGVQRVTVTDARRRVCPYVYKSLGVVTPRVLSSRTF